MKSIETLRAELNRHLVRYAGSPSPIVARIVVDCLEQLILHPDFHADFAERCSCKRVLTFWRLRAEPLPARSAA